MRLTRYLTAPEFRAQAEAFLVQHEAEHNLMLGLMTSLAFKPDLYPSQPYFAVVTDAGRVSAAALMTPPHGLAVSYAASPEALRLIVADVAAFRPETPSVIGPAGAARLCAELWQAQTGQGFRRQMAERIYRLERVIAPAPVSGQPRRVEAGDQSLLLSWLAAFQITAFGRADAGAVTRTVHNMLTLPPEYRSTFVWEDPYPVALVSCGGPTPHSRRVGPVYTPPEFRRRGYASALTAAVSQYILDQGCRVATLFTDLANPTSNKIYQAIGYEAVCDADQYEFTAADR
ncbi:MAG: GNAT family N-acetyltransferase [Anaerolineales bacterium]|nr:GNAT family N-acetyltransferase [Anaerolineales bacterium]